MVIERMLSVQTMKLVENRTDVPLLSNYNYKLLNVVAYEVQCCGFDVNLLIQNAYRTLREDLQHTFYMP